MKNAKFNITLLIFVLLFTSLSIAQEKRKYNFPTQLEYKNVLIQTMGGAQILCSSLKILPDSNMVQYFDLSSNETKQLDLKEIDLLKVAIGNKAAIKGLYGAGSGFAAWALLVNAIGPESISSDTALGTMIGCTGCGLLSGIYTGSQEKSYKIIYQNGDFIVSLRSKEPYFNY